MTTGAALLTAVLLGLKVTGFISYSWWLVFLPLYGGLLLIGVVVGFCFVAALITEQIGSGKKK
jgi:hypothetical protein